MDTFFVNFIKFVVEQIGVFNNELQNNNWFSDREYNNFKRGQCVLRYNLLVSCLIGLVLMFIMIKGYCRKIRGTRF